MRSVRSEINENVWIPLYELFCIKTIRPIMSEEVYHSSRSNTESTLNRLLEPTLEYDLRGSAHWEREG